MEIFNHLIQATADLGEKFMLLEAFREFRPVWFILALLLFCRWAAWPMLRSFMEFQCHNKATEYFKEIRNEYKLGCHGYIDDGEYAKIISFLNSAIAAKKREDAKKSEDKK